MPDILKRGWSVHSGESVSIPDVRLPHQLEQAEPDVPEHDPEEAEFVPFGSVEADAPEAEPEPPPPPTREELIQLYREELDALSAQETERAYFDAFHRHKAELRDCIDHVDRQLAKMEELQAHFMQGYARELKFMAVEVAQKLVMAKIEEDDVILQKLVVQTVSGVKNAQWIDVEVSERLVNLVEYIKLELEKPEYRGKGNVTPTASPADTVRVSTESGTVVSTVSVQADNLREAFAPQGEGQ